jgi:two-component system, chemotaxis family, sensor kinase CheA
MDEEARRQRRLEMFRQVAGERIGRLNLAWIDFETKGVDPAGFLREGHTLKGEASLTGFVEVSRLVHLIEGFVKLVRDRHGRPDQHAGDLILRGLDLITELVQGEPGAWPCEAADFAIEVQALLSRAETGESAIPNLPAPAAPPVAPSRVGPARREASVRIASEKIDRLRGVVSDMLLSHVRCRQLVRELHQVREIAEDAQDAFRLAQDEHRTGKWAFVVDSLPGIESRLREEAHGLSRVVADLDNATRELRMTPLWTLLERFPVPLRALARSLSREVVLHTEGEQVEVDKALLQMLEEPLLHLLRNAVDHGIEDAEARKRLGKPAEATVRVVASVAGQRLHLRVSDDGAGIDLATVRRRAVEMNLLGAADADSAPDAQIIRTIFAAGFTTRRQITELSGRGIGLNVVLEVVEGLGGTVDVTSRVGAGTTFDVYVPITVAISRVVLFRVGMGTYGLPATSVRALVEARAVRRVDSPEGPAILYNDLLLPLLDLGKTLDETRGTGANTRIIIAQSGADLVALRGSSDHLEREVVLKPMVKFFERQPLVTSVVTMEDGTIAVVLKASELMLLARSQQAEARAAAAEPLALGGSGRLALVVDDSPIVRDIIAEALRCYGLQVLVANDGEEALAVLAAEPGVDIVLTDMDMPRLDGLGLVRAIRSRGKGNDIPVVAISMRGNAGEKRLALEAGVQGYIDKSDFTQALLWRTVSPFVVRP